LDLRVSISNSPSEEFADRESRLASIVWIAAAAISFAIVGLIVAAPLAQAHGNFQFAASIYKTFSFVCHQIPERSFHLAGNKFAVCSRCTGLYSGFAVAVLAYPLTRSLRNTATPSILWLILAALPLAIDFSVGYFNIWANTHASRFATGALFSATTVFYIVPGLIDMAGKLFKKK
jgi:uncharacterized membrane protein